MFTLSTGAWWLPVAALCLDQLILTRHRGEVHKRWICSSTQLFIYSAGSSILPSSSPAQRFNPARANGEIRELKRVMAVCRMCAGVGVGRVVAEVFKSTATHFLEPDAVFFGGKVRLVGGKEKALGCSSSLLSHLCVSIFPVCLNTHTHSQSHTLHSQVFTGETLTPQHVLKCIQIFYSTRFPCICPLLSNSGSTNRLLGWPGSIRRANVTRNMERFGYNVSCLGLRKAWFR